MPIVKNVGERGIIASVITDAKMTKFHSVPTKTCLELVLLSADIADELAVEMPLY